MAPKQNTIEKLNLRKELEKYTKNWIWFLLCIIVFLVGGYFYLRYTTPIYNASASIIIVDEESGANSAGNAYAEMDLFGGMAANNVQNELGILRSRRIMNDVVKALNLHIQYFMEGEIRTKELYENVPFSLQVLRLNEEKLKDIGSTGFEISTSGNSFVVKNLALEKTYRIEPGKSMDIGFANIVLNPKNRGEMKSFPPVIVRFTDIEKMASHYRNQISFIREEENSSLIELELNDPVKEKARDVLDQLVMEYNRAAIEDKNLIAGNTAKFINERLAIINEELDSVETGKETFKEQNRLTDIQAESQMFIQNASEYNKQRQEVGTQLELSNAMLQYLSSSSSSDLLPANLGITESGVNQQITEYNNLVLERNRILSGSSEKNPVIIRLNSQISQIKNNILNSLKRMRSNLQISQGDLDRQASSIGSKIYAVPSQERQFRGIERQQSIKETLYLFLLQKREETSLSLAVTEPKAKIVDRAFFNEWAVSPRPVNIYMGGFVLAMFLPFSIIYVKSALDNKVRYRNDLENLSKEIPLVGTIPKMRGKKTIIENNDRSVLAESFRILITNLQYLLVNTKEKNKGAIIFVTSTIKGEGKTTTSINLGLTLANTSKRVLIIGADLRNPKLHVYLNDKDEMKGLSDYLIHEDKNLFQFIKPSSLHENLNILNSGSIPPNPYELLKQEKIGLMFSNLREHYDYIIVDTAPSMLVADTFLITKYADLILYVVRAGYTEIELLEFALKAKEENKFHDLSFILNDVKNANLSYGNKYGYGYNQTNKRFWKN